MISATFWLIGTLAAASPPPGSLTVADLSPALAGLRAEQRVPGIVAIVTDRERVIAEGAAGVRVLDRPAPIRPGDVLHIGSVTKPFTATLLATLVDEGRLRWETTAAEALPDLVPSMRSEYRSVTLAQLLSHEAGVQAFGDDASPEFLGIPDLKGNARAQRHGFAAYALSLPPVSPPGTAFRYSNAGVAVAAAMAEAITGGSWEKLIHERVLLPLGATTAGVGWPNVRDAHAPWGHIEKDGKLVPTPPEDPYRLPAWTAPAGDLSMSLPDLARLARLHLEGVDGKDGLVRAGTVRTMHRKRLRGGLGWGVSNLLGHDVSTFSGSAGTFLVMIALIHDADLAVMVGANAGDSVADAAVKGALKALIVRFAGDRSSPSPSPAAPQPRPRPSPSPD